jgi:hypothetical protein
MSQFSVVITTFDERFSQFLVPLIKQIKAQKNDIEVIVMANGPFNRQFNSDYRRELLQFLSEYNNIFPTVFPNFQSLAKLWNRGVLSSTSKYCLVLNDDVAFLDHSNESFLNRVGESINQLDSTFTINGSFSHFVVSKSELIEVGFFDERLLGLGEEDGDFVWRYFEKNKCEIADVNIPLIKNIQSDIADQGYKKGIRTAALFNREFIKNSKYQRTLIGGYRGMFDNRVKKILADEKQYPYEDFFLKNIKNL